MTTRRNTFKAFQEKKQSQRSELVSNYLESLKGKGISFPHITALAEVVARHVAGAERDACNKSTLLRNTRYRSLLSEFLKPAKPGVQNFDLGNVVDNAFHAVVTTSKLEVVNLRRENERLKIYISGLERVDRNTGSATEADQVDLVETSRLSMEAAQIKYVTVCQALHSILEYMKNMVAADADAEQLVDLSKMRNNVIVDRRLAAPFFEWLRSNKGIL